MFHNKIHGVEETLDVLRGLSKLTELSIDLNPVNTNYGFKQHLIMQLSLEILEGDKINDLDRDLAKAYYK